jgi:uncharacterized protein YigA (DUF484 family)
MTTEQCECASIGECLEACGGEQSLSAEEWELARLRNRLREAEHAAATFERQAQFWQEQTRRYRAQLEFCETSLQSAALELARSCR